MTDRIRKLRRRIARGTYPTDAMIAIAVEEALNDCRPPRVRVACDDDALNAVRVEPWRDNVPPPVLLGPDSDAGEPVEECRPLPRWASVPIGAVLAMALLALALS